MTTSDEQIALGKQLAEWFSNRMVPAAELEELLTAAPDLGQYDARGHMTALGWAARYDQQDHIRILLDAGADIEQPCSEGYTPLHISIYYCRTATALLLDRGAPVNVTDKCGNTPLMTAALKNNLSAISKLIALGADVSLRNNRGQTALDVALAEQNMPAAALIRYEMPEEKHKRFLAAGLPLQKPLPLRRPGLAYPRRAG